MARIIEETLLGLEKANVIGFHDFSIGNRQLWDNLPDDIRKGIIIDGENIRFTNNDYIPLSLFRNFKATGNRKTFEDVYFAKRRKLSDAVIAECAENEGRFISVIEEGIWSLLSEPSWVIPAHNSYVRDTEQLDTPLTERPVLDLFACETGEILALTAAVLGRKLNPIILKNIYSELERDGRFKVKLFCVNPAANLQNYLEQGNSTIFFSATLLPIRYYKKLLSVETDDYAVYAESPFPEENRLLIIGRDVSTRYTQRGQIMYRRIAEYIAGVAEARRGNYMAFFPSYRFMEDVYEEFIRRAPGITAVVQSQFMDEKEREQFLERFEASDSAGLVGFCVMGGIFSEGIDLAADRLIGAVVVGTGLPQVCNDREIVKQYFDSRGMDGFDYSYRYPGMNKVLQSAGRVIRTENDRGIIVLLDDRFCQKRYQELFPREWKVSRICSVGDIKEEAERFWEE